MEYLYDVKKVDSGSRGSASANYECSTPNFVNLPGHGHVETVITCNQTQGFKCSDSYWFLHSDDSCASVLPQLVWKGDQKASWSHNSTRSVITQCPCQSTLQECLSMSNSSGARSEENTGGIIAGVIVAILVVAGVSLVLFILWRRRAQKKQSAGTSAKNGVNSTGTSEYAVANYNSAMGQHRGYLSSPVGTIEHTYETPNNLNNEHSRRESTDPSQYAVIEDTEILHKPQATNNGIKNYTSTSNRTVGSSYQNTDTSQSDCNTSGYSRLREEVRHFKNPYNQVTPQRDCTKIRQDLPPIVEGTFLQSQDNSNGLEYGQADLDTKKEIEIVAIENKPETDDMATNSDSHYPSGHKVSTEPENIYFMLQTEDDYQLAKQLDEECSENNSSNNCDDDPRRNLAIRGGSEPSSTSHSAI